jgi:hypothetical protein
MIIIRVRTYSQPRRITNYRKLNKAKLASYKMKNRNGKFT